MDPELIICLISPEALAPTRESHSVGYDVYAYGSHTISPGETKIIPLGFNLALPEDHAAFMWDRSSFGAKGIHIFREMIVNMEFEKDILEIVPFGGVLDWSYRGQCGAIIHSFLRMPMAIPHGMKIAQFVIQKCEILPMKMLSIAEYEMIPSDRGKAGYGCSNGQNTPETAQAAISNAQSNVNEETFQMKKD